MNKKTFLAVVVAVVLLLAGFGFQEFQIVGLKNEGAKHQATLDNDVVKEKDFKDKTKEVVRLISSTELEEIAKYKDSVVMLNFRSEAGSGFTGELSGLGVVIEDSKQKYILSLFHILSGGGKVKFDVAQKSVKAFLGSGEGKGRTLDWRAAPSSDLVVLDLPKDLNYPAIPLGDSDSVKIGEKVYIIGWPGVANKMLIRESNIASVVASDKDLQFLKEQGNINFGEKDIMTLGTPSFPGDSGAPILRIIDGKAEIVAINKGFTGVNINNTLVPFWGFIIKINPIMSKARDLMKGK